VHQIHPPRHHAGPHAAWVNRRGKRTVKGGQEPRLALRHSPFIAFCRLLNDTLRTYSGGGDDTGASTTQPEEVSMRMLVLGAAMAALLSPLAATSASAQPYGHHRGGYDREVQREIRECRRELRRADSRREYQRELRECRREIAQARREARRDWRRDRYGYGYGYDRRGW